MNVKSVAAAACGLVMLCGYVQAGEVKVLASGAVKEAALELFPHSKNPPATLSRSP